MCVCVCVLVWFSTFVCTCMCVLCCSGETLLSPLVMCGPHGLKFQKPVELRLPHCASMTPDGWSFALKSSDSSSGTLMQEESAWITGWRGAWGAGLGCAVARACCGCNEQTGSGSRESDTVSIGHLQALLALLACT